MIDVLEAIGRRTEDIDVVAFTHLHFDHAAGRLPTAPGPSECPLRVGRAGMGAARKRKPPRRRDDTVACHLAVGLRMRLTRFDRRRRRDLARCSRHRHAGAFTGPHHVRDHVATGAATRRVRRCVPNSRPTDAPEWLSVADSDTTGVQMARRRLLAELAAPNTLGFGSHFGDQAFGRVVTDDAGAAHWAPVPTFVLGPSPRQLGSTAAAGERKIARFERAECESASARRKRPSQ
jgi:hypothetical protein